MKAEKTKAAAMPTTGRTPAVTPDQMKLLRDLYALQQAGFIQAGDEVSCHTDYDDNTAVFMAPTVTYDGQRALEEAENG